MLIVLHPAWTARVVEQLYFASAVALLLQVEVGFQSLVDLLVGLGCATFGEKGGGLLSEQRWKEMDWDSDGSIDFGEFVITFSGWIDMEEDE